MSLNLSSEAFEVMVAQKLIDMTHHNEAFNNLQGTRKCISITQRSATSLVRYNSTDTHRCMQNISCPVNRVKHLLSPVSCHSHFFFFFLKVIQGTWKKHGRPSLWNSLKPRGLSRRLMPTKQTSVLCS